MYASTGAKYVVEAPAPRRAMHAGGVDRNAMTKADQDDEIVAEVRRARAEFYERCGGTLEGLFAKLREFEKKETRRLVSYPPRKFVPAPDDSKQ
jgi:hypothetical protein